MDEKKRDSSEQAPEVAANEELELDIVDLDAAEDSNEIVGHGGTQTKNCSCSDKPM